MKLERQLRKLNDIGISLNENVFIDDLLYSFKRKEYEKNPFDLILFVFGIEIEREPWGRFFSSNVWNFDTECITSTGDYVKIIKKLCTLSGNENILSNITDLIDRKTGVAWIKYSIDTKSREWEVELNDDWVDMMTISYIIDDIEKDGKSFYFKENGQAMILFYLDAKSAKKLKKLSNKALKMVNVK